ncbi:cell adhesion molecule 3-like isoform X1 [Planococcus citri]|uniref:cell adhesion molecule 3-like isoform X1 n=1 Tax=Planococcus citri TaxID=170843 RepID=UPI0031F88C0D
MILILLLLMLCAKFHEVTMDDGTLVMFVDTGFPCNDGTHIRRRQICNGKRECYQNEDENFCSYNQRIRQTFAFGQNATLYCDASTEDKDDSFSKVSWFDRKNELIHGFDAEKKSSTIATNWSSPTALKRKAGFTSTTQLADLTIYNITIEDRGVYECLVDFQYASTKITYSELFIAMNPSSVNITNKREYLLAGKSVDIECRSEGSYPVYEITWSLGSQKLRITEENNDTPYNDMVSVLTFQPSATDDGRYLTCRSRNPLNDLFGGNVIEDKWRLNVQYTPICKKNETEIHRALKQETVLLNCEVNANPPPIEFIWSLNSSDDMKSDQEPNFIATQQDPFFNYTPKSDSEFGILSCKARNTIGKQITACSFQIVAAGKV